MKIKRALLGLLIGASSVCAFAESINSVLPLTEGVGAPNVYSGGYHNTHIEAGTFTDTFTFVPSISGKTSAGLVQISSDADDSINFTSASIGWRA